ncbi:MAG: hypothetical protein HQM06_08560 [Magnetococcales bacterium]|nr:hypothetical protein [Magnetococcales bacterium]
MRHFTHNLQHDNDKALILKQKKLVHSLLYPPRMPLMPLWQLVGVDMTRFLEKEDTP